MADRTTNPWEIAGGRRARWKERSCNLVLVHDIRDNEGA